MFDDYRDSHPGIIKVRVDVMVDSGDLNHCVAEDVFKRGEDGPKITVGDYTACLSGLEDFLVELDFGLVYDFLGCHVLSPVVKVDC